MNSVRLIMTLLVALTFSASWSQPARAQDEAKDIQELIRVFDADGWANWRIPDEARKKLIAIGEPAIPFLIAALGRENNRVRRWAGATLDTMASIDRASRPKKPLLPPELLIAIVADETQSKFARRYAATLLGRIGGADAVNPLSTSLRDKDIRIEAAAALGNIAGASAVKSLIPALETDDPLFQKAVIKALGNNLSARGPSASIDSTALVGALAKLVESEAESDVKEAAVLSLGRIGSLRAVPILVKAASGKDASVGNASITALINIADSAVNRGLKKEAAGVYEQVIVLTHDPARVTAVAEKLERLSVRIDISERLGIIRDWRIVGPFDNADGKGFEAEYPPQIEFEDSGSVTLDKIYESMGGNIRWIKHKTQDNLGEVKLTIIISSKDYVVAYAYTTIDVPEERDALIRIECKDSIELWLNSEEILASDEHRPHFINAEEIEARFLKGENKILLKVCHTIGEWGFGLRILGLGKK